MSAAVKSQLAENEQRRPGITRLFERIRRDNPGVSARQALIEAKVRYSNPRIAVRVRGELVEVDNPDYLAARDR